jgi:putative cardiolipin synthase
MNRAPRWVGLLGLLATACSEAPPPNRLATTALLDTDTTRLGRAVAAEVADHLGQSGILPLHEPHTAFAARVLLAEAAERSLDAQYYIWHDDETGFMLFEALWRAAERGVRVRLLIDDNTTAGQDRTFQALDSHPNIAVRLYNPLRHRRVRALSYLTDFRRANRRMHNKSFTVDTQASVVGGRNIGNEYFGAGPGVAFTDFDVVAVGPVVEDVSATFDRYWNSPTATPVAELLAPARPAILDRLHARFELARTNAVGAEYVQAVRQTTQVQDLIDRRIELEWATTTLVADDPAKTLDADNDREHLLLPRLLEIAGKPLREFDLVSPYFVPKEAGTAAFGDLARAGVRVRILTNSLVATDVTAVHAGYAKRRQALLEAGVELFELKRAARPRPEAMGGSSGASLHAKTFAIDRSKLFVGSFNFDPRSAELNTEMGFVIESPKLAALLSGAFDTDVALDAYEVALDTAGRLRWIETREAGDPITYVTEPGAGLLMRAGVGLLSLLPIEWLL